MPEGLDQLVPPFIPPPRLLYADLRSETNNIPIVDPECDIAVGTMAQLLLQQGKVAQALKYFQRAAELSRTESEVRKSVV